MKNDEKQALSNLADVIYALNSQMTSSSTSKNELKNTEDARETWAALDPLDEHQCWLHLKIFQSPESLRRRILHGFYVLCKSVEKQ